MKGFVLDPVFAQRVARFIRYDSDKKQCNVKMTSMFAEKTDVSVSVVLKVAMGVASLSPMKKRIAEEFLDSYEADLKQRPKRGK